VAFTMGFALGDLGERRDAAEPESLDPPARLGDGSQQSIAGLRIHGEFRARFMHDAFHGDEV